MVKFKKIKTKMPQKLSRSQGITQTTMTRPTTTLQTTEPKTMSPQIFSQRWRHIIIEKKCDFNFHIIIMINYLCLNAILLKRYADQKKLKHVTYEKSLKQKTEVER